MSSGYYTSDISAIRSLRSVDAIEPRVLLDMAVKKLDLKVRRPGELPAGPLARELGLNYQRVYRWFQEGNEPDYEGTMLLLERCGWLNMAADVPADERSPRDRLAVIEEGVIALLSGQDKLLEKEGLERPAAQDASQSPTPAAPKKSAAKAR